MPAETSATSGALLQVRDLRVAAGETTILDGISFDVSAGRTLGIVGESGSGKSMATLAVLGLLPSGVRVVGGSMVFRGQELVGMPEDRRRSLRGRHISMVFQDPLAALNPVMRIGDQVGEILRRRSGATRRRAYADAVDLLRRVDVPDPEERAAYYPHQFSGGLRQRALIAMALAGAPQLILADEPTTALDVTVQGRILRLLGRLQIEDGLGMVLVSHDLRVIANFADDIVVMRRGRVVESGRAGDVLGAPSEAYTRELIDNVPTIHHVSASAREGGQP